MKTADFIREHHACREGTKWALSISDDMSDVWDMMVKEGKHEWLIWTATRPGVFSDTVVRKLACRFVRETPLHDGRTVWDLLTYESSRKAVEVAEAYVNGKATDGELADARNAADAAYHAARAALAADAAYFAANTASRAAADAAACAASESASRATAARIAADAAADAAADFAPYAAASYYTAAKSAQVKMIAELGNPFKEENETC